MFVGVDMEQAANDNVSSGAQDHALMPGGCATAMRPKQEQRCKAEATMSLMTAAVAMRYAWACGIYATSAAPQVVATADEELALFLGSHTSHIPSIGQADEGYPCNVSQVDQASWNTRRRLMWLPP